jgi:hypothetical protein
MKILRSEFRRPFLALTAISVCVASVATMFFVRKASAQQSSLAGFRVAEIRSDESMGGKKPTPTIPSTWRFIGVSNGEKGNSNNLWFQDKDGSIYRVQGFTTETEFILLENIQKLNAGK